LASAAVTALLRALRLLRRAAEAASALAFAAIFVLFLAGIFARYVLASPLGWADELIMVVFLWLVFLTEAFVIAENEQVTFDAVYDLVGERARRVILLLGAIVTAAAFIAALPVVLDYVQFLWRERTTALQWRLDWVYSCFVVYWVAVIVRALAKLVQLLGPGWRGAVARAAPDERANLLG